jgi:hypothetical protein
VAALLPGWRFEALPVAAQPCLDALHRGVRAGIGILGIAMGLQHRPAVEMERTVRTISRAFPRDGHVTGPAAIEIFAQGIGNTVGNPLPQCLADVEILARNAQRHRDSSLIWAKPPAAVTGFSCGASPEPPTCPAGALNR